jgi:hypothetical protein
MTFKQVLLRISQTIFSFVFLLFLVGFIGFFTKAVYRLFMFGYNLI